MFEAIIKAKSKNDLKLLGKRRIDFKGNSAIYDKKDFMFRVDAIISDQDKKRLESEGYIVEIVSDLSMVTEERSREVSKTNRFSDMNMMAMTDEQILSVTEDRYMNVEEIETELIDLSKKKYPKLLELIELPNKSAKKNKISRAIRIHTPTETNKPAVMFTGGVHAREWGTSDICMHFIRQLLHSYKNNLSLQYKEKIYSFDQVKKIVENLDIIVFPDVNPDGKEYSQGGGQHLWRKNCNPTLVPYPNHEEEDFHKSAGVDLNRNFDFLWYSGIGTVNEDNTNQSQTYRGPTPFSEPESRNVKFLFDQYKNIKCFVDIHCHVGQILMSWGHDDTQCFFPEQNFRNPEYNGKRGKYVSSDSESGPEFYGESYGEYMHPLDANTVIKYGKALYEGLKAVRGREYELKPSVGLYPTSGTSQDYAFSQRDPNDIDRVKIFAYTIEFGQRAGEGEEGNFTPPYSVMRKIMDDIASALTELCYTIANEKDSI